MTPVHDILTVVIPHAESLLPRIKPSKEARVLLLAIGLQESGFRVRKQLNGPARGYWQFEKGGGVTGVLSHPATKAMARSVCHARGITDSAAAVYTHLERDDVLACAFARLLLYSDPRPLPAAGQIEEGWEYYIDNWRPGKPHRDRWSVNYAIAMDTLREARQL